MSVISWIEIVYGFKKNKASNKIKIFQNLLEEFQIPVISIDEQVAETYLDVKINAPQLLIADEPTTALDVTIQAQILDLMRRLQRETGTAIVLITHDLGVIAETVDRVLVMYGGEVMEEGPVQQIFDAPRHDYTKALLTSLDTSFDPSRGDDTAPAPAASPPSSAAPPTPWITHYVRTG